MTDCCLISGFAALLLLSCASGAAQTGSAAPKKDRDQAPSAAPAPADEAPPLFESPLVEEPDPVLTVRVLDGLTYVQHESAIYLVDPASLTVTARIESPDHAPPACIVTHPSEPRFVLMSQSGQLSLWESNGVLVARSQTPGRHTSCHPTSLRVSWEPKNAYFLTNFDEGPGLPWAGISAWKIVGTMLEPTRISSAAPASAEFVEPNDGVWVQHNDDFQIFSLDGKVLHRFTCDLCVPSPNGRMIAVNQATPRRHTRLVDLTTGSTLWESTLASAHVWSPSMRWILGTDGRGLAVVDARDGRVVTRWTHPGRNGGEDARWFGDVLVETGARKVVSGFLGEVPVNFQVVFWKEGDARPRIENGADGDGAPEITSSHMGGRFLAANTIFTVEGKRLARLEAPSASGSSAQDWSADDRYVGGMNDDGLVVWDSRTGKIVSRLAYRLLQEYPRYWSPQGHDLLISEGKTLLRHTPEKGTVRITPQLNNGALTFDVQEVRSWYRDYSGSDD